MSVLTSTEKDAGLKPGVTKATAGAIDGRMPAVHRATAEGKRAGEMPAVQGARAVVVAR